MNLVLDFTDARETACHSYTGVRAHIGTGEPAVVTITPQGCHHGLTGGATTACEAPVVDRVQAWSVAVLLTGGDRLQPASDGLWDPAARRMDFALRSAARRPITDGDQPASDIRKSNL